MLRAIQTDRRAAPSTNVFDGRHLRATLTDGLSRDLIVTFDHWRRDRDGFAPARNPDFWTGQGFSHLDIQTARNDWFFNRDTLDLAETVADIAAGMRSVKAIGFSMGAYGALLLAEPLGTDCLLLSSPQSGVPRVVGRDPWARDYLAACDRGLLDLTQMSPITAPALILFDPLQQTDAFHARRLAETSTAICVAREGAGHPAAFATSETDFMRSLVCTMTSGASFGPDDAAPQPAA